MAEQKDISKPTVNKNYRIHPTRLVRAERETHVVNALLDYNRGIIESDPIGATAKFDKLKLSPFVFLRGTADLMYRDLVGTDANMATVLLMGDVHLENFGVMETEDRSLMWGLNDFDEAAFGPFTWDVKRAATSIALATAGLGFKNKDRLKLTGSFADAYLEAIDEAAESAAESMPRFKKNRGTSLIRDLIEKAEKIDEQAWLAEYVDGNDRFRLTDEIKPLSDRVDDFQEAIDAYLPSLSENTPNPPGRIQVLDVATKTGSGTGSIGLWRFYVLCNAQYDTDSEKIIIEIKHERPSVLAPYVGEGPLRFHSEGSRVAFAQEIHLPDANPYYGHTMLDDVSYLARRRSPFKARIKLENISKFKKARDYVNACAAALAFAHARSDLVLVKGEQFTEARIRESINARTFRYEITHFAKQMARQVRKDWKVFLNAHEAGKFTFHDGD